MKLRVLSQILLTLQRQNYLYVPTFKFLEERDNFPVNLKFGRAKITTNEKIVLASMFYPLYALAVQLSPEQVRVSIRCLSVLMSVCPYVCLSLCLSVLMSVCPDVRLFLCLSVLMSVCPYVCLSLCLSVHMSVCPYVCLSFCLSVLLSLCLFLYFSISQSLSLSLSLYWLVYDKLSLSFSGSKAVKEQKQ